MNLPANIPVAGAKLPAIYEGAKAALAECQRIDECKDWADKAAALASYAKQSEDKSLEKMAMRIRLRAYKRAGELLKRIKADKGGRPSGKPMSQGTRVSRSQVARDAGMSEKQKNTALRVASVPEGEFEKVVESEDPPAVKTVADRGKTVADNDDHELLKWWISLDYGVRCPECKAGSRSTQNVGGALAVLDDKPDPGQTHGADCWRDHHACAVDRLERLEGYCRALMDKSPGWEHDRHHCGWNSALGHILAEFLGIDDSAAPEDAPEETESP